MAVTLPSVSSSGGTMSALGIGSGLDANSIVSQLMAVEQQPLTLLDKQEASYQAQITTLGTIKGAVSSLQTAAQALASLNAASYRATASDSSILTATSDGTAVAGSYPVAVDFLAQPQKLIASGQASSTAAIGSGATTTLTFTFGTISNGSLSNGIYSNANFTANAAKTPVSVTIGNTNNTLSGIRDAINAANIGVTATIVNDGSGSPYRLVLTSNDTGAANSMKITVSGDAAIGSLLAYDPTATQNLSQTLAAQNAQLSVDGVNVTSASNSVSGAIQGVTLNLLAQTTSGPVTVTVQRDTSSITSALNSLVQAYNGANHSIASATAKGATLQGDWGVLSLELRVRSILGDSQNPGGTYTTLSQLGISFQDDGSLALDSSKLSAALAANPSDVTALVTAVGNVLNTATTGMLGTSGPIASETDGINRSIADIDSRRTAMQQQLAMIQTQYQQQFSALDTLISSMNQTSTFLTQQLANLQSFFTSNKG